MNSNQKPKKPKGLQLGPLNLSKSQYKPCFNGLTNKRGKQNLITMGPLENIMFDIPQIEEASEPIQLNLVEKLRLKIGKCFQQKSLKSKQQWDFYIKKAQIVQSVNSSWTEVESFLLRVISDLFYQWKLTLENVCKLQKFKQQTLQAQSQINLNKVLQLTKISDRNQKHSPHYSLCNMSKLNYSLNELPRGNLTKTKICKIIDKKSTNSQFYDGEDSCIVQNQTNPNINASSNGCSSINAYANVEANLHEFKITRLERQIDIYREKIATTQKSYREKLEEMEKRIQFQQSMKYNETLQEKMKYQSEVQNKKFYNDVLLNELKVQNMKNVQLSKQLERLKRQSVVTKVDKGRNQSIMQYKQMWKMQYQEIRQLNIEIQRIHGQKDAQITKNKGLKQKLKELSKNFNYNYNISMENEKQSQDLNRILKDFRDWLTFFAVPRVSKGMMNNNTFFPEMSLGVQSAKQDYLQLLPKDDPTNYRLLRPNFFIYFESYQGIIMTQKKFPQKKILPPIFYLTIRGILDALFLHFTFTFDYNQWLSFPEFVISYLQKFEINLQTSKPTLRKIPCQSEDKINFLLNVFNLEAPNTWEREIFRSFLLEDFMLDQLYFYLDCRDHLLKGAQLNANFGALDPIVYVRVNVAEELVKEKLRNYDKEMLERLKKFINSKKKTKNNKELIDMNFVLKLLLEVYSIQKLKSQRFFYNNFKTKSGSKISYTEYSAFMSKNFEFLTKGQIAKLYREIYTLGVSHITYKTIHFVCSIKGLFIPLLRNKSFSKFDMNEGKYPKPFEDILFLHLQNSLNNVVMGADQYGLETVATVGLSFNQFLHDCEANRLQRHTFSIRLLEELEKIIKIRTILAWKNKKSIIYSELTKDQVRQRLGQLLTIINQSDDDFQAKKKLKQTRQKAMKKLTRNFKIRIQQSLAEFKILDKKQYEVKIGNANNIAAINNSQSHKISAFATPTS